MLAEVSRRTVLAGLAVILPGGERREASRAGQRNAITPEQFGAKGDGVTVDTAAINRALAWLVKAGGGEIRFSDVTYIVDAPLDGTRLSHAHLTGPGTVRAKAGTIFRYILDISGAREVTVEGLSFDANKTGRAAAGVALSCVNANATVNCRFLECTFSNSIGGSEQPARSSVALAASAGCSRLLLYRCKVLDCGINALVRPSDGFFVRGNDCTIRECHAQNVTDHAFVLEGCNRSQLVDCVGYDCTSIAAMSNDTAQDVEGNLISGIRGTSKYLGSFGGIIGAYAFGQGRLRNSRLHDIEVKAADHAGGNGAGLFFHGNMDGILVDRVDIGPGTTRGVMNHTVIIDGVRGMRILNSRLRADRSGSCIRLMGSTTRVLVEEDMLIAGAHGIYADGDSAFAQKNNRFVDCDAEVTLAGAARYLPPD